MENQCYANDVISSPRNCTGFLIETASRGFAYCHFNIKCPANPHLTVEGSVSAGTAVLRGSGNWRNLSSWGPVPDRHMFSRVPVSTSSISPFSLSPLPGCHGVNCWTLPHYPPARCPEPLHATSHSISPSPRWTEHLDATSHSYLLSFKC